MAWHVDTYREKHLISTVFPDFEGYKILSGGSSSAKKKYFRNMEANQKKLHENISHPAPPQAHNLVSPYVLQGKPDPEDGSVEVSAVYISFLCSLNIF